MSGHDHRNLPVVHVLLISILCLFTSPVISPDYRLIADEGEEEEKEAVVSICIEDISRDGNTNIVDVIALLLLAREDPDNPEVDYDGNGSYSVADAISLLLNIRDGNLTLRELFSIIGRIVENGRGLGGIELSIDNPDEQEFIGYATTDSAGMFRFDYLSNGTYGLRPLIRTYYYTFEPKELEVTISGDSVILPDIQAFYASYTLSGRIVEDSVGLAEVTVSVKGVGVDTAVVTDSDGMYSVESLFNAPYTVVPTKDNYTFDPYSLAITMLGDSTIQDINATPAGPSPFVLHTIGGRIFCAVAPLSSVMVLLMGDMEASTVTDASGSYTFIVPDGRYTIVGVPIPDLQVFNPPSIDVTVAGQDIFDMDFVAWGAGGTD